MKNLLDIPLETPKSDLPHYAKRWKPEGFRERMKQRKAKAAAGTAMLLLTAPVWAESSAAYKMYVENPEVGQAFNAVFIGLLMLIAFNGIIGWLIGNGKGRGKAGFWFGILLGWIGWIVAAFLQPSVAHEAKRARAIREAVK